MSHPLVPAHPLAPDLCSQLPQSFPALQRQRVTMQDQTEGKKTEPTSQPPLKSKKQSTSAVAAVADTTFWSAAKLWGSTDQRTAGSHSRSLLTAAMAVTWNLPGHTLHNFERPLSPPQLRDGFWFHFIQALNQMHHNGFQCQQGADLTDPRPAWRAPCPVRGPSSHPATVTAMAMLLQARPAPSHWAVCGSAGPRQ